MGWLACGVLYSIAYLAAGAYLRERAPLLVWLRMFALLIPALIGIVVIVRRRRDWMGCQWLFWATIALGLGMTAISIVDWTADEVLFAHQTSWLGWYTVFALFGAVAPLFAMLAQPHRGTREPLTASTAVDVAGIAVVTGFLYSHFVIGSNTAGLMADRPSLPLVLLQEFQQLLVCLALTLATFAARGTVWATTYRRLATGSVVSFAILTISSAGILQGLYRSGGVYDVTWILPFAFFAWAAASAPGSDVEDRPDVVYSVTPSRPWIIFAALGALPLVDFALRRALPSDPSLESLRDLSLVITIFSVLPLLMARLAVENSTARQADRKRALLAAAIEQADDLISIMTATGQIEYGNTAFCRAVASSPNEVSQASATTFLAEESRAQLEAIRSEAETTATWRGTLVRQRKDRSTFPSACSIVALSDGAGRPANFVAVEHDTSHELQLRDQLIHSERLAAVGQLVSGIAHEVNNPLQSIMGFTELLMASERRNDTRADLERIRSAASRAAKIVKNLLTFVRRSAAERLQADLNDIVRTTVGLRRYELVITGIELEEEYSDDLPPVLVNREEIQQIVLNLVLNAEHVVRSTGRPGRISVRTLQAGASHVAVDVHDNGPGVPPAVAGRIFEPFFSTKNVGEGTGLGLSIALGIAEAHGGSLALIPDAMGARFRLTLPARPTATNPRVRSIHIASTAPGGCRALVLADEPGLRQLLRRLLIHRGFAVDLAETIDEARDLLAQHHCDVVFCDAQLLMPTSSELGGRLRDGRSVSSPVWVFMSGSPPGRDLQRLIDASGGLVLSKPFEAAALDTLLGTLGMESAAATAGP